MKVLRKPLFILWAALIFAALSPAARADEWNKKTIVTFDSSVEVPGQILPPGTYVFKLVDFPSDRRVVQIWNQDESQLLQTILAIPDYRLEPAGDTILKFQERPGESVQALRAWFYPGDNFGLAFVYPNTRAAELAASTNTSLPATSNEAYSAPVSSATSPGHDMGEAVVSTVVPETQPEPAAAPQSQPAQPQSTPDTSTQPSTPAASQNQELPKTASLMPLLTLIGFVALGAAYGLGLLAKRAN